MLQLHDTTDGPHGFLDEDDDDGGALEFDDEDEAVRAIVFWFFLDVYCEAHCVYDSQGGVATGGNYIEEDESNDERVSTCVVGIQ